MSELFDMYKCGYRRTVTRTLQPGEYTMPDGKMVVKQTIRFPVTQEFNYEYPLSKRGDLAWRDVSASYDKAVVVEPNPPEPTLWQRISSWFWLDPSKLPRAVARVRVREEDISHDME